MNKKILFFSLLIMCLALFGCSKTANEYLEEAKQSYEAKEYEKAVNLYEKSCKKGSFQGCSALAKLYNTENEAVKMNVVTADKLYKEAIKYADIECNKNNKEACSMLAYLYEKGLGTSVDLAISDKYQIQACNLGSYGSCYYIARLKADNMDDFLMYMDKACSYNFADACITIGNTYLTGFNENMVKLNKDVDKGLSYMNKACQLNNQYCANLADIYISGDDVMQNYTDAVKNYEMALHYYESLCTTYDEDNNACRNINIIKSKYSIN